MKRVTLVVPWGEALGGAEIMLLSLLRHIDRTRVAPSVVFLRPGSFVQEVAALDVPTRAISSGRMRQLDRFRRATAEIAGVLYDLQPDAVCAWSAKSQLYTALAARRRPKATWAAMWWQHGIPEGEWLDRLATALPGAIACSSHAGAAAQRCMRPRRQMYVVHPGTEAVACAPRRDVQLALGIPDNRVVIAVVGRLQPWKNQHRVLEAVAQLRAEGLPVHALVIGGTAYGFSREYPAQLSATIVRLRLGGAVTLTGHVKDARSLVPAADVLVNASDGEPFGIVLIEAMAAGVPVVAVNSGGPAEIVQNGVNGFLVSSSAPADLAQALRRLAADTPLRQRFGIAGQQLFAERFTAQRMAEGFCDTIDQLLS